MKIAANQIEHFIRNPQPSLRAVLLYGPDHGLIQERAQVVLGKLLENPQDPFAVTDLSGDAIKDDPARLADEVAAMSFFGGRKVVRIREHAEKAAEAIAELLRNPPAGPAESLNFVLVLAEELTPKSALRSLFEAENEAAALPCYHDEAQGLSAIITQELRARQLTASGDVVSYLSDVLRGDRMLVRQEMEKLDLYAGPERVITAEMVRACIGDVVETSIEEIAGHVAGGNLVGVQRHLPKAWAQGVAPIMLLRAVARHFQRLAHVAGQIEKGTRAEQAIVQLRPALFFKEQAAFRQQLQLWPRTLRIQKALSVLYQAELKIKISGIAPELLADRALSSLARKARGG